MTKEVKKLLLVIWMTVVAVCCLPTITVAEEGAAKSDEREEMISDAVLPVAVGYRNDSGGVSYYLNGTSFLINEQAVLTNKHVAVPDEILLEKIMEEHALNELPEKDERLGIYVMTGKICLFLQRFMQVCRVIGWILQFCSCRRSYTTERV